jgi:hypothetical protein
MNAALAVGSRLVAVVEDELNLRLGFEDRHQVAQHIAEAVWAWLAEGDPDDQPITIDHITARDRCHHCGGNTDRGRRICTTCWPADSWRPVTSGPPLTIEEPF